MGMIDRDKAIDALDVALVQMHGCGRYTPEDVDDLEKAAWDVLKLLESKPPVVKENAYGWKFHYCPGCGREFAYPVDYCDKCGQAVKWDG